MFITAVCVLFLIIVIQLQPKIISLNKKVPGHSKYRHSTKFPVPLRLNTKQHRVTQATYQKPLKYTTERRANYLAILWFEIHSCSRDKTIRGQLLNDFSQFARGMRLKYIFHGNDKEPYLFLVKSDQDPPVQPSVALEAFLEEVKFLKYELANIKLNRPKDNL